jgi:hypothetical protein
LRRSEKTVAQAERIVYLWPDQTGAACQKCVLQGCAVEKLHRYEMVAVLFANVVNGADVRVIQC